MYRNPGCYVCNTRFMASTITAYNAKLSTTLKTKCTREDNTYSDPIKIAAGIIYTSAADKYAWRFWLESLIERTIKVMRVSKGAATRSPAHF